MNLFQHPCRSQPRIGNIGDRVMKSLRPLGTVTPRITGTVEPEPGRHRQKPSRSLCPEMLPGRKLHPLLPDSQFAVLRLPWGKLLQGGKLAGNKIHWDFAGWQLIEPTWVFHYLLPLGQPEPLQHQRGLGRPGGCPSLPGRRCQSRREGSARGNTDPDRCCKPPLALMAHAKGPCAMLRCSAVLTHLSALKNPKAPK